MRLPVALGVLGLAAALMGASQGPAAEPNAAAGPAWTMIAAESTLAFTAEADGPITGRFTQFAVTILGDPDHPATFKIKADVDIASVTADLDEVAESLPTPDWLDAKAFPMAHYESRQITKRADGSFQAEGDLTLRGVRLPVGLQFRFPAYGPKPGAPGLVKAVAEGTAVLKRTAFKVGRGDWAKVNVVADPVTVSFTIAAERPAGN